MQHKKWTKAVHICRLIININKSIECCRIPIQKTVLLAVTLRIFRWEFTVPSKDYEGFFGDPGFRDKGEEMNWSLSTTTTKTSLNLSTPITWETNQCQFVTAGMMWTQTEDKLFESLDIINLIKIKSFFFHPSSLCLILRCSFTETIFFPMKNEQRKEAEATVVKWPTPPPTKISPHAPPLPLPTFFLVITIQLLGGTMLGSLPDGWLHTLCATLNLERSGSWARLAPSRALLCLYGTCVWVCKCVLVCVCVFFKPSQLPSGGLVDVLFPS